MPDLIRHPVPTWIPAFAGMTILRYLIAGVILPRFKEKLKFFSFVSENNKTLIILEIKEALPNEFKS